MRMRMRQMVDAFERASSRTVPYQIVARRHDAAASVYAEPSLAQQLLGWKAELDLDAMCRDAWRWQQMNPEGCEVE
jgi:UDP-glucose 4-epimerase